MVYDTAWDMPQPNWVQQGSYEQGSIPPITEPDAGAQVWLGPVAREWVPWICGAADQLRNPSSWIVANDTAMYNTLRRVDTLLGLLCGNGGSAEPVLTRFQGCVLQNSSDGGVTWVDVPGWVSGFPDCVRTAIPPPPPNIGPTPIQKRACNIAGYLAAEVIDKGLSAGINSWTSGQTLVDFMQQISQNILAEALPFTNFFVQAVGDVYTLISTGNIAALQAAMADPALWSDVTCAIYNAIQFDGEVTAGNWAAAVAKICALSYTPTIAVTTLCAFVSTIGVTNMQHYQVFGAADVVDCTGCGEWCIYFDFTAGTQGWSIRPGDMGHYVGGVGWQSDLNANGDREIVIQFTFAAPIAVSDLQNRFCAVGTATGLAVRKWYVLSGATVVASADIEPNAGPCPTGSGFHGVGVTGDTIVMNLESQGAGSPDTILSIEVAGTGTPPIGFGNCAYDPTT